MTLRFYFDQHMPRAVVLGLQRRAIDVLTTQDEGTGRWRDERLLERSTELDRVFVTEDEDLLAIAHRWMEVARPFTGLVRTREPKRLIGRTIEDLLIVAHCYDPQEIANQVVFVPL
jgi:predicted nuclease of predicted toxin-antitoxin system